MGLPLCRMFALVAQFSGTSSLDVVGSSAGYVWCRGRLLSTSLATWLGKGIIVNVGKSHPEAPQHVIYTLESHCILLRRRILYNLR